MDKNEKVVAVTTILGFLFLFLAAGSFDNELLTGQECKYGWMVVVSIVSFIISGFFMYKEERRKKKLNKVEKKSTIKKAA